MKLLTTIPMARRLGVSLDWLLDQAESSELPSLDTGHGRLFNAEAVEQILAERAVVATIRRAPNAAL